MQVDLPRFQFYLDFSMRRTHQSPACARLKNTNLKFAVIDATTAEFHALITVNIAAEQSHDSLLPLFSSKLFGHLLLVALFVLEYY